MLTVTLRPQPVTFDYTLSGSSLARLATVNDLGVTFDPKLLFVDHIIRVRSTALRLLGMLYRFTDIKDPAALKLFFTSIVLPIIEYCSPVWGMAAQTNLAMLSRVTSFFCRIVRRRVYSMHGLPSVKILANLGINTLSARRQCADLMFVYDIVNGNVLAAPLLASLHLRVPSRVTRLAVLFHVARSRTEVERRSLLSCLPALYNTLPSSFNLSLSRSQFRTMLRRFLK